MTAQDRVAALIESVCAQQELEWEKTGGYRYAVVLPGTHKLKTVGNLIVGEHALRIEAFVMRQPDENRERLWAWLLQRNARMYGVAFSIDAAGDVYLTGRVGLAAVTEEELDRLLGSVLRYADESFDTLLEIGFGSAIRREWAWRVKRGESLANLRAFAHLVTPTGQPAPASLDDQPASAAPGDQTAPASPGDQPASASSGDQPPSGGGPARDGGPLAGLRVIEIAGIGPAPFAGMVLADLGAEVLRVDRPGESRFPGDPRHDLLNRGKRSAAVDLGQPRGAAVVRTLATRADVLIEGFRPGVAERLGIGPDDCRAANPRLVYGRMTGWGQHGYLARTAGHDITYLALSGALHAIGPAGGAPVAPVNLLGDYGGGGLLLVAGVLAALWQAGRTGAGQVVDAAVLDGTALLATQLYGFLHSGLWQDRRGVNLLDGGAPWYGVYPTADGRYLAVGPLEPKFYAEFLHRLGLDTAGLTDQYDVAGWPRLRALIAARLASRTRDEWVAVFDGSDACVAPVLSLREAAGQQHPQLAERGVFTELHGVPQPAPAPRFSTTPAALPALPPPRPGEHTRQALLDWGLPTSDVDALLTAAIAVQPDE